MRKKLSILMFGGLGFVAGVVICCLVLPRSGAPRPIRLNNASNLRQVGLGFRVEQNDLVMSFEKLQSLNQKIQK